MRGFTKRIQPKTHTAMDYGTHDMTPIFPGLFIFLLVLWRWGEMEGKEGRHITGLSLLVLLLFVGSVVVS